MEYIHTGMWLDEFRDTLQGIHVLHVYKLNAEYILKKVASESVTVLSQSN